MRPVRTVRPVMGRGRRNLIMLVYLLVVFRFELALLRLLLMLLMIRLLLLRLLQLLTYLLFIKSQVFMSDTLKVVERYAQFDLRQPEVYNQIEKKQSEMNDQIEKEQLESILPQMLRQLTLQHCGQ